MSNPDPSTADLSAALPNAQSSRAVLDEDKRWKIIALLANGCSRRMAAKYVGCATSTITRTAARDPQFNQQLAAAEQSAEIEAIRAIRAAARKKRYWRAAAWFLERRNPIDFGDQPRRLITLDQAGAILADMVETLSDDLPEANYQRAIAKLDEVIETFDVKAAAPGAQTTPSTRPIVRIPEVQHPTAELDEVTSPKLDVTYDLESTSDVQQ